MPYATFEVAGGRPVEVYHFISGIQQWYLTSADTTIVKGADFYLPAPITRGKLDVNEEARTNNISIVLPSSHAIIGLFKGYAPAAVLSVVIFRKQLDDPDNEWTVVFSGDVTDADIGVSSAKLNCMPIQSVIERRLLKVVAQPLCNNRLYDNRCLVNRAAWTFSFPVAALTGSPIIIGIPIGFVAGGYFRLGGTAATVFADNAAGYGHPTNPANWLSGGVAVFGNFRMMITLHSVDHIWVQRPIIGLQVGDIVTLYAGCNKDVATCRDKFANLPRFLGFPYMPTKNPFGEEGIA